MNTESQKSYLFNSEILFLRRDHAHSESGSYSDTLPDSVQVEPLKLKCINVTYTGTANFMSSNTWDFQVEGGVQGLPKDQWYQTHYDWALIVNNQENYSKALHAAELRDYCKAADKKARRAFALVDRIAPPDNTNKSVATKTVKVDDNVQQGVEVGTLVRYVDPNDLSKGVAPVDSQSTDSPTKK